MSRGYMAMVYQSSVGSLNMSNLVLWPIVPFKICEEIYELYSQGLKDLSSQGLTVLSSQGLKV